MHCSLDAVSTQPSSPAALPSWMSKEISCFVLQWLEFPSLTQARAIQEHEIENGFCCCICDAADALCSLVSVLTLAPGDGNQGIFFLSTLDEKAEQTTRRLFEMGPVSF